MFRVKDSPKKRNKGTGANKRRLVNRPSNSVPPDAKVPKEIEEDALASIKVVDGAAAALVADSGLHGLLAVRDGGSLAAHRISVGLLAHKVLGHGDDIVRVVLAGVIDAARAHADGIVRQVARVAVTAATAAAQAGDLVQGLIGRGARLGGLGLGGRLQFRGRLRLRLWGSSRLLGWGRQLGGGLRELLVELGILGGLGLGLVGRLGGRGLAGADDRGGGRVDVARLGDGLGLDEALGVQGTLGVEVLVRKAVAVETAVAMRLREGYSSQGIDEESQPHGCGYLVELAELLWFKVGRWNQFWSGRISASKGVSAV